MNPKTQRNYRWYVSAALAGLLVFSAGLSAKGNGSDPGLIVVQDQGTMVTFAGGTAKAGGTLSVRIDGPGGVNVFSASSNTGIVDWMMNADLADGTYVYDAWFVPENTQAKSGQEASISAEDRTRAAAMPSNQAKAAGMATIHRAGVFTIQGGAVQPLQDSDTPMDHEISAVTSQPSSLERLAGAVLEFLIPSASAGTCAAPCEVGTGESQVTLIPNTGNSWELETASDGSFYRIGPDGGSSEPFKLQAGAPINSLYIEGTTGDIGMHTATPDTSIEINESFPNISLVDTDNGQDYELLNNGGIFFLSDRTSSAIPINVQGNTGGFILSLNNNRVGIGNFVSPDSLLHVRAGNGSAAVHVEDTGSTSPLQMFKLDNNGFPAFNMTDTSQTDMSWTFRLSGTHNVDERFTITKLGTGSAEMELAANGNMTIRGTYFSSSSRTVKDDIVPVDGNTVLAKLDALPVAEWSYKADRDQRHVGPMAEDFYAVFGLGPDDKHVAATDMAGLALAAAKALKAENEQIKAESASKDEQIRTLSARLDRLEKLVLENR